MTNKRCVSFNNSKEVISEWEQDSKGLISVRASTNWKNISATGTEDYVKETCTYYHKSLPTNDKGINENGGKLTYTVSAESLEVQNHQNYSFAIIFKVFTEAMEDELLAGLNLSVKTGNTCIERDRTKTKKSLRTLPLMPVIERMLLRMKEEQLRNRDFFKNCYEKNGYIYVHEDGTFFKPNYITTKFGKFLKERKLKHIRFHDLRHSCATLMRHEGVKLEDIQKWLGHSQIATTERIYAHFEEKQHIVSANLIEKSLQK